MATQAAQHNQPPTVIGKASPYNEGKGIHYALRFSYNVSPVTGEKRRGDNASRTTFASFYAHESCGLMAILFEAFKTVGFTPCDSVDDLHSKNFDAFFSLNNVTYKNVYPIKRVNAGDDYWLPQVQSFQEMIRDATVINRPTVTIAIDLKNDQLDDSSHGFFDDGGRVQNPTAKRARTAQVTEDVLAAAPPLPPKMSLGDFCELYQISDEARAKLVKFQVTGPHALRFLSDDVLKAAAFLHPAEIADLRDAHERWLHGMDD